MSDPNKRKQLTTNFRKVIRYLDNTLQERNPKSNAPICCDKDTLNYILNERTKRKEPDAFTLDEENYVR